MRHLLFATLGLALVSAPVMAEPNWPVAAPETQGVSAEGLAAVTKEYGIPGILGRTKDEEAEARKKAREEKEAAREKELQAYGDELRSKTLTNARAAEIMGKMKSKEIAKLDKAALKNPAVIHSLNTEDLKVMNREGVDREVMKEIYANIVGREGKGQVGDRDYVQPIKADLDHPAYKYVSGNPFGRRGGIATPAENTSSEPAEPRPQVSAIVAPAPKPPPASSKPEKPKFEI